MITMESTGRLTHQRRRTRLLAVVGSALAAVAVWAVAEFGLGINVREPAGDVGAANVVFASVVASLAGWALLALLERVTARAARWWPAIATTVALLSLVAPLTMPGVTTSSRVVLALLHLVVAATLIPLLSRTARGNSR